MNQASFRYFGLFLRMIAPLELVWMVAGQYFVHRPDEIFKLPAFSILSSVPPFLHHAIFVSYCIASLHFIFMRRNAISAIVIAVCFLYFDLHDKFSFHHSIFLAANFYFLYGVASLQLEREEQERFDATVFCLKFCTTFVYLVAGLYKLTNVGRFSFLIEDLVSRRLHSFLKYVPIGSGVEEMAHRFLASNSMFLALGAVLFELGVPLLIWTRYKGVAVMLAAIGHSGIVLMTGQGGQFNFMLPAGLVLFFSFEGSALRIPARIFSILQHLDVANIFSVNTPSRLTFRHYFGECRKVVFLHPAFVIMACIYVLHLATVLKRAFQ